MLAGGLAPDNVRDAIRAVRPWAVDASSSLETAPGVKDHDRVRAFVEARAVRLTLRRVRRALRARDADPGARRARGGLARRRSQTTPSAPSCTTCSTTYAGRPTPLTLAERFAPGKRLYLKREDLSTPARTSSTTRSARRCSRAGSASSGSSPRRAPGSTASRPRPCARASASSASSTWAPRTCAARRPNVERMHLLGAEVRPVEFGTRTLKEATSEAIRDWITNVETTHYLIGSCVGPAPVPRDRARAAGRDRPRGARADPRGRGSAAGHRRRVRRRRLERDRDVRGLPRRRGRAARRRRGGRRGVARHRAARRPPRRALVAARGRGRPGARRALDLRGPRLPGRRARSTRTCATPGRAEYVGATDEEALDAFHGSRGRRGSSRRSSRRTRSRARSSSTPTRRRLPLRPRRQGPRAGRRMSDKSTGQLSAYSVPDGARRGRHPPAPPSARRRRRDRAGVRRPCGRRRGRAPAVRRRRAPLLHREPARGLPHRAA